MARRDARALRDEVASAIDKGKFKRALECIRELEEMEPRDASWPKRAAEVYRRLGVRPVINARGTWTYLSGSLELPEVRRAMDDAARPVVVIFDLQQAAGRKRAEWSGAAVDVPTGRLYVTSNRWVSKITVIANDERERDPRHPPSAGEMHYALHCAACHGPARTGVGVAPPLIGLKARMSEADVLATIDKGKGVMPPNLVLKPEEKRELVDFLFRRNQPPSRGGGGGPGAAERAMMSAVSNASPHKLNCWRSRPTRQP